MHPFLNRPPAAPHELPFPMFVIQGNNDEPAHVMELLNSSRGLVVTFCETIVQLETVVLRMARRTTCERCAVKARALMVP